MVPLNYYLILGAVVFAIGVLGVIVRRDLIVVLMSIELMLNAVNLTFIAFARFLAPWRDRWRFSSSWRWPRLRR
jgi:NADH:ubiquinone oxidoreductase subunit K